VSKAFNDASFGLDASGAPRQVLQVRLVDNDLFLWEARLAILPASTLGKDLAKYYPHLPAHQRCVVLRFAFEATHPYKWPLVRVVSPRFLRASSNVVEGGGICMSTFSPLHWSPSITAEAGLLAIQSLLLEPTMDVQLDPHRHGIEYTEAEGIESTAAILRIHSEWNTASGAAAGASAAGAASS
jgi:ubiquitin-protein ligase